LERQEEQIRVFDSTGAYVRTIGREGAGPGEFKQAVGLA
jgi:6-bladed beta-propeller